MTAPALPGTLALTSSATISPDGVYRYDLTRQWGDGPLVLWIMLNPSTADADIDDPTIRRCIGFSQRDGAGGLVVVNRFALRATDPAELRKHHEPVGPDNRITISRWILDPRVTRIVAAWGAHRMASRGTIPGAPNARPMPLWCLGFTRAGQPRHPLYVRADQPFVALP